MTILILGASGMVGGATARGLAAMGAGPVRCLVRDPRRAGGLAGLGVQVAVGDLDDPSGLAEAVAGVERVLLLAPLGPELERREGAAIDAAARAGVRHVVKVSTIGVAERGAGAEPRPYPAHRASERRLERSGMAWTHLRPGPFFQNLLAQAPAVRADGVLTAAYRDAPPEAVEAALTARGAPAWLVGALGEVMARVRAGMPAPLGDGVERVCGRRPRAVEEFARDHAEAFGAPVADASGR